MDAADVRKRMLAQFGLRIEPKMSEYVLKQLAAASSGADAAADTFPVMGGDARTGAPVRRFVSVAAFTPQQQPAQQPVGS